jgi:UDP-glucose 4-epimerase
MVINLFVDKVFNNEPLTVYKPGTQSRNYIHIDDASRAYIRSAERLQEQLSLNETGVERYEIASSEDPGVMTVAEIVRQSAQEEIGIDVDITLVENPRSGETLVDQFGVDISKACEQLNWEPQHTVESSIRQLLHERDAE